MISKKCEKEYKKLVNSLHRSLLLTEKLYDLIEENADINCDLHNKNLFYLEIIAQDLFKLTKKINCIVVNSDIIEKIECENIVNLRDFNLTKQLLLNDNLDVDVNFPINIFNFTPNNPK